MRTHVHSQDDALRSAASVLDVVTSARRLASWRDIGSASRGRFPCSIGSPGRNRTFVANPDSKSDPRSARGSETVCRTCSARGQTSGTVRSISPESDTHSDIAVTSRPFPDLGLTSHLHHSLTTVSSQSRSRPFSMDKGRSNRAGIHPRIQRIEGVEQSNGPGRSGELRTGT